MLKKVKNTIPACLSNRFSVVKQIMEMNKKTKNNGLFNWQLCLSKRDRRVIKLNKPIIPVLGQMLKYSLWVL